MSAVEMKEKENQESHDEVDVKEEHNLNTESSPKPKDLKLLDLGWGLESIHLSDPYDKEYLTLGYTSISFAMALMVICVRNYAVVLMIAVINVILQTVVFVFAVYKYKHPKKLKKAAKRISMERHLSMSSVASSGSIDRQDSMPPLATEYESKLYDETEKRKINRKLEKQCSCFVRFHTFFNSFDTTFGRGDDPVFVRPYYFRFNAVLYGVFTSIFVLCNVVYYKASPLDICAASYGHDFIYSLYEPDWDKPEYNDYIASNRIPCTNMVYVFEFCALYWVWWIAFSLFDLYELKDKYYRKTTPIMETALGTLSKRYINKLYEKAEAEIYDGVKANMQLISNIYLVTFLYCVWYIFLFLWRYLGAFNVTTFPNLVCPIFEALINTNITMSLFKICKLSKYPLVIATVFGEPIYCGKKDDILAWWQLRHIYKSYRMPIYIRVLNPVICIGFVFVVILPFWAVMLIIQNKKDGEDLYIYPVYFFVAITLIFVILYCMKQFVSTHEKQKTHVGMLQKEVIRLEANKDEFEDVKEMKDLIKLISEYMRQFDKPISIATIPMTNAVFTLLRGVVSGIALVIVSEIIDAS